MTGNWCPSKLPFWRCAEVIRPSQIEWRRQRGQAARYRTQNQSRRASCHTYGYDAVSPSTRGRVVQAALDFMALIAHVPIKARHGHERADS